MRCRILPRSATRASRLAVLALVAAVLMLPGCESFLGKQVVRAPNHGKPLAKLKPADELTLPGTVIDHRLRVEVAEPPASLAVWVIDPAGETIEVRDGGEDEKVVFEFERPEPRQTWPPRGTVFLLHGYYDDMNQRRYQVWARLLAAEGYRAVLIDQRGHGESTGDWSTFGVAESGDMIAVADALAERGLLVEPVGVMAVSMGASTAVRWAEADERVRAMVLLSTYANMRDVVRDFGRAIGFDSFSLEKFNRITDHAGAHGGFDPDEADSLVRMPSLDAPTLIVHGETDRLIPIHHALRLYHAGDPDTVELIRVRNAGHTSLGNWVVEPIHEPAVAWFERHLFPNESESTVRSLDAAAEHPGGG
ncbi:MAG: alpha/beta fold hydrolase [Planctomycetota bacterium]